MTAVPMDKYLQGPSIASQQAIQAVLAEMIAPRDEAINGAFQQLALKLQQLEAALGQVALAAQQPKMSPFEVALKALQHFGDGETDPAPKRCHDKAVALIERWLDAGLETSEAGGGDAGRAEAPTPEAEAEDRQGEGVAQSAAPGDQAEAVPAEND
jgi:hypothetical protein